MVIAAVEVETSVRLPLGRKGPPGVVEPLLQELDSHANGALT